MLDQVAPTLRCLPYRGDYGSVVTEDAFGARPRSPVTSPTWEEGNTAFDGEFDTLQNVFNDRQREMDDEEVESLRTPVPAKPQPGGGGGKTKKAAEKGGKKKKVARRRKRVGKRRKVAGKQLCVKK